MSRYRLYPTSTQEAVLRSHCSHARFVWNLACEQHSWWHPGRAAAPGWTEHCRQLTEARGEFSWLRAGSQMVQQQALRDFAQAVSNHVRGSHGRPRWRKAGQHEGFRVVAIKPGNTRRLSRKTGEIWVPKVGWVRFRWSRPLPEGTKSYRITMDRAGHWHVAFAAIPEPIPAPGTGVVVGIDRGVAIAAALSNGQMLHAPRLSRSRGRRLKLLQRKLARAKRGSKRRRKTQLAMATLRARETRSRKDWAEKISTDLARRFDVIRVEDLRIKDMCHSARGTHSSPGRNVTQKAGLNREILASGWGLLVRRLEDKAPGRVEKVRPAYTSQRCSACGHIAPESRESQALFRCIVCGYACNADVNAARNIAAGHAVAARGGLGPPGQ
jgi:putative transposase